MALAAWLGLCGTACTSGLAFQTARARPAASPQASLSRVEPAQEATSAVKGDRLQLIAANFAKTTPEVPASTLEPAPAAAVPVSSAAPWEVGVRSVVRVPGDHDVIVYHAPESVDRVAVYLHGHCGDVGKIESWAPTATRFATVVALTGNRACPGRPGRFKWGFSLRLLNQRLTEAVDRVALARDGHLDAERIAVIGYSQGAMRAEQLPRRYPERYPWVVLAGPPTRPHPWRLAPAKAVVVIAGENERNAHMRRGFTDLQRAGLLAAYMTLPSARHGEFGPNGAQVMTTALWWLFDRVPASSFDTLAAGTEHQAALN